MPSFYGSGRLGVPSFYGSGRLELPVLRPWNHSPPSLHDALELRCLESCVGILQQPRGNEVGPADVLHPAYQHHNMCIKYRRPSYSEQPGPILQKPVQSCHEFSRLLFVRPNRVWLNAVQFLTGSATSIGNAPSAFLILDRFRSKRRGKMTYTDNLYSSASLYLSLISSCERRS